MNRGKAYSELLRRRRAIFDLKPSNWLIVLLGPVLSLPRAPISLFFSSIIVSLLATLFFALIGQDYYTVMLVDLKNTSLQGIVQSVFFDPILWHIVILVIVSVLIFMGNKYVTRYDLLIRIIATFIPLAVLFITYAIGSLLLKDAFSVSRPIPFLQEAPLSQVFRQLFDAEDLNAQTSMPSGFITRQLGLFLFCSWITQVSSLPKLAKKIFSSINIIALIIVIFSRLLVGPHTPLDVAVSLGVGTVLFWLITLPIYSVVSIRTFSIDSIYLSTLAGAVAILYYVVLSFSTRPVYLTWLFLGTFSALGLLMFYVPLFNISFIKFYRRLAKNNGGSG